MFSNRGTLYASMLWAATLSGLGSCVPRSNFAANPADAPGSERDEGSSGGDPSGDPPDDLPDPDDPKAFPGAEGFGTETPGGRGGAVYEVVNLDDDGPGSLRAAVEASGPRTIVFRVAGLIEQREPLRILQPYVTIAGQTAPGGGITLVGEELRIQTHDVVLRHLRIRTGDVIPPQDGWDDRDAVNVGNPDHFGEVRNVVLDHCSLSWSVDELFNPWYASHDVTLQYCLLSEALTDSYHPSGVHGMAVLIGDGSARITLHHNLIAHCDGRNPQIAGVDVCDVRNNVVYNWGEYGALFKSPGNRINFVGNTYRQGPDADRSWVPNAIKLHDDATDLSLYIEGNVDPVCPTGSEDNWDMLVWLDGSPVLDRSLRSSVEHAHPQVTTQSASEAYELVLDGCGATLPERDPIDERIVADVRNGTGSLIDSPADVGGWVDPPDGTPPPDSDHDGMPDDWELARNLSPFDPSDGNGDRDGDGYTNLEEYLDDLTRSH